MMILVNEDKIHKIWKVKISEIKNIYIENIYMQNFNNFCYEKITAAAAIIPLICWKIIPDSSLQLF
jgi:hypothetical protein